MFGDTADKKTEVSPPVALVSAPREGRYVVAARDLLPGEILHYSVPYAISFTPLGRKSCRGCVRTKGATTGTATGSARATRGCSGGGKAKTRKEAGSASDDPGDADGAVLCSDCGVAAYCSARCREAHRRQHTATLECHAEALAAAHAARHAKGADVQWLTFGLTIVLRCASEGAASSLMDATASSTTDSTPLVASTSNKDDLDDEARVGDRPGPSASPAPPAALADPSSPLPTGSSAAQATVTVGRVAATASVLSADLRRIREAQLLPVEVVDAAAAAAADTTAVLFSGTQLPPPSVSGVAAEARASLAPEPLWADVAALTTNRRALDRTRLSRFRTLHRAYEKIAAKDVKGLCPPIGEERFVALCAALQCNGFGLFSESDAQIAFALYPSASYFNHSCDPNVCRFSRGRALEFRALRAVAKGERLCISYIDTDEPASARQQKLLHSYFFECACDRCRLGRLEVTSAICRHCGRGSLCPVGGASGESLAICTRCDRISVLSVKPEVGKEEKSFKKP